MKIIAVDDEMEALSNFLLQIINDKQIEYKFFLENPLDAIDYCEENAVDAAFLDIRMPIINGVDLAEKPIKINPSIKIIFITGFTYDEEEIQQRLGDNLLGFCYKPFDSDKLNFYVSSIAAKENRDIFLKCQGPFDLFVNGRAVGFKSTKAKELLALLTAYHGSTLTMSDAIYHLWPEKELDLAKKLYRDAVWRLRKTLKDNGVGDIVEFGKAKLLLRIAGVHSDYWDCIDGMNNAFESSTFMTNYDWANEFVPQLNEAIEKKSNNNFN